jgi:hypothetical protein
MKLHKVCLLALVAAVALLSLSACAVRKVSVAPAPIAFQTATYAVIQTSPNTFTVLTRSKAAMEDIAKRLGCGKEHLCANEWDGEVFTIQRIK